MTQTPIKLTLYNRADGEAEKEYTCKYIPWGVLKKAVALTKTIDAQNASEDDLEAIADLVVMAFGDQFTVDDLDAGADIGEMLAVLQAIVARASSLVTTNPTILPSGTKRRK